MNFKRPLILASSSPRRQFLMQTAGFSFTVISPDIEESFPLEMPIKDVPRYLAEKKARALLATIQQEIIIAADTVVIVGTTILNKPEDRREAMEMLQLLSGQTHSVITAVCLLGIDKMDCFDDRTEVTFKKLSVQEIEFYIDTYKPYDKAGAYGAQDWLGMIGIEKINGSYFTVMGIPMHKLYAHLSNF